MSSRFKTTPESSGALPKTSPILVDTVLGHEPLPPFSPQAVQNPPSFSSGEK